MGLRDRLRGLLKPPTPTRVSPEAGPRASAPAHVAVARTVTRHINSLPPAEILAFAATHRDAQVIVEGPDLWDAAAVGERLLALGVPRVEWRAVGVAS